MSRQVFLLLYVCVTFHFNPLFTFSSSGSPLSTPAPGEAEEAAPREWDVLAAAAAAEVVAAAVAAAIASPAIPELGR